jgi:hypothetical protein
MSLGGALLLAPEPIALDDALMLSFTAPALWDPLLLRSRVAWVTVGERPYRTGVSFEHKSAAAVLALYELIVTLGYE